MKIPNKKSIPIDRLKLISCWLIYALAYSSHIHAEAKRPINWQELAKPYHSRSAVNPPKIIARPKHASLSVPAGFIVREYLAGFSQPRYMLLGPDNEILLADMAAGIIYSIRDKKAHPLIKNLTQPYGMALYKEWLYVATATAVMRYRYPPSADPVGTQIIPLQAYASGHITRAILFDEQAAKLYLAVGSRSNVSSGEPAIRAAVSRYNPDGSGFEIFASGIRNPIGLHWAPGTHQLWISSHERDGLGDDLVPDYFTGIALGEFYGWPYAYIGPHEDPRHQGKAPAKVQQTQYPNVLLGSHVGAMDFTFYSASQFPPPYNEGAFIALHGSWNRSHRVGYKIVFVPFKDGQPLSGPQDFLTGWRLSADRPEVWGRPVGVLQMPDGGLLISDDAAGKLWHVSYAETTKAP